MLSKRERTWTYYYSIKTTILSKRDRENMNILYKDSHTIKEKENMNILYKHSHTIKEREHEHTL